MDLHIYVYDRNISSKLDQISVTSGLFGDEDDEEDNGYLNDDNYDNDNDVSETVSSWKDDNRSMVTDSTLSMMPGDQTAYSMETKIKIFVRSLSNHLLNKVCMYVCMYVYML